MKNQILAIAILLTGFATGMNAQQQKGKEMNREECPKFEKFEGCSNQSMFTDEQKEQMKTIHLDAEKKAKAYKDEIRELKAKQETLETAESPNMKAINANLEKIGEAKIELAKIHAETRVKTRAIMTEEQRIMMDSKKHKMRQGEGRDRDFARGPENGRNKQRAQQGR